MSGFENRHLYLNDKLKLLPILLKLILSIHDIYCLTMINVYIRARMRDKATTVSKTSNIAVVFEQKITGF